MVVETSRSGRSPSHRGGWQSGRRRRFAAHPDMRDGRRGIVHTIGPVQECGERSDGLTESHLDPGLRRDDEIKGAVPVVRSLCPFVPLFLRSVVPVVPVGTSFPRTREPSGVSGRKTSDFFPFVTPAKAGAQVRRAALNKPLGSRSSPGRQIPRGASIDGSVSATRHAAKRGCSSPNRHAIGLEVASRPAPEMRTVRESIGRGDRI